MTILKKIILYFFGIILVIFGNRVAINTVFAGNETKKTDPQTSTSASESSSIQSDSVRVSGKSSGGVGNKNTSDEDKSLSTSKEKKAGSKKKGESKVETTVESAKTEESSGTE